MSSPERTRGAVVVRVGPLATIQDHGRLGHARWGVPWSGPLDPEAMDAALSSAGTDTAIELPQLGATFRAVGQLRVAIDFDAPFEVADGALFEVPRAERAVRYVAFQGGIDVPPVLGSRATLVSAGLGGFHGRALRRGDIVPIGDRRVALDATPRPAPEVHAIETVDAVATAGADRRWLGALLLGAYRVDPRSDRVGTRLVGVPIEEVPEAAALSRPMVRGAVQLPSDGQPVVIGPDGPTTGGYPVVAVLTHAGQAKLGRLRPGQALRFRLL